MIDKVSKLLAQAERAGTPEEAEAFFEKAQLIAATYSIELAKARAHTAKKNRRDTPIRRTYDLADVKKNNRKHLTRLYLAIGECNDVLLDIGMTSPILYPYGFAADIDVVEAIFAKVAPQMVRAADEFIRSGGHKMGSEKVDGRVARTCFYDSYIFKIQRRLQQARRQAVEEATGNGTGTELVLADKSREVRDYYKATTQATARWDGPKRTGFSMAAAKAGARAGEQARLEEDIQIGGAKEIEQ